MRCGRRWDKLRECPIPRDAARRIWRYPNSGRRRIRIYNADMVRCKDRHDLLSRKSWPHMGAWASIYDSYNMPSGATGKAVFAAANAATARAAIGAAKAPSKVDISASATLGAIDASAIKVTTTDVILTLSGGVDGQGWDIINPTTSTGIAIPAGVTLWKSIGSNVGPTTIALGGGRPIRITRIDANTWIMLGSQ